VVEKKCIEGKWWLPGQESTAASGTLTFDPQSGATLAVEQRQSRSFDEILLAMAKNEEPPAHLVIFGCDDSKNPITLHRCVCHRQSDAAEMEGCSFTVQSVFLGAYLSNPDEIQFGSLQIEIDYLYVWLGLSANRTVSKLNEDCVYTETTALPKPIELDLGPHGTMHLLTSGGTGFSWNMNQRLETRRWESRIWWQLRETVSLKVLDDYVHAICRLFSLLVGKPVRLRGYSVMRNRIGEPQIYEGKPDTGVEVLRARYSNPESVPEVWGTQFAVLFEEVRNNLAACISRWFDYHTRFKTVLDLYFGEFFSRSYHSETRFVLLTQALEVYHRIRFPNGEESEDKWQSKVAEIVKSVPIEYQEWLSKKLKWSNEKRLRKRLEELVGIHAETLKPIVRKPASFAGLVTETRNHFTHWGSSESSIISDDELPAYTDRVRRLLQICILSDLCISNTAAQRIIGEPLPKAIEL
jgi:hypothetical protein